MNFRSVLSYVGVTLEITGILVLIPVFFSWIFGEQTYTYFFIAAVVSFMSGTFLDKKFEREEMGLSTAMMVSALSFIFVSLIGAIPYLPYAAPIDAVFESVSGFTTTGLSTMVPESLPYSLLVWRSLTQWIGGIGILVISLLLLESPGLSSYYLYKAEGKQDKIEASMKHTVRSVLLIYGTYTLIGIVLLTLAGMSPFDSLNHAFTSVSTGGFSTHAKSIGYYASPYIESVIIFLMTAGATSFFVHKLIAKRNIRQYLINPETRIFWALIILFSILLSISFAGMPAALRSGIFHSFSALTTTGYTTLNSPPMGFSVILLVILMIIGGYAGSTAGGIKLIRSGVIAKSIPWLGKKISLPQEAVVPFKLGDRVLKDTEIAITSLFVSIYFATIVLTTLVLSSLGYPLSYSFFESASAQGTVGLSVIPLHTINPIGKVMLMLNMLLGRLEIFPYLVTVYALFNALRERFKNQ